GRLESPHIPSPESKSPPPAYGPAHPQPDEPARISAGGSTPAVHHHSFHKPQPWRTAAPHDGTIHSARQPPQTGSPAAHRTPSTRCLQWGASAPHTHRIPANAKA